jgi:hypothetical protein
MLGSKGPVIITLHPSGDQVYTDNQGRFTSKYEARHAEQGLCIFARDPDHSRAAVTVTNELGQPIKLSLSPTAMINGKIVDPNGTGIPAARIRISVRYDMISLLGVEVLTDTNGCFALDAIPPEHPSFSYRLSIDATDYGPAVEELSVKGNPDTPIVLEPVALEPANKSISGVVVDANGVPAPGVILMLRGDHGTLQPLKDTATNARGEFAIKRICKGYLHCQVNFASNPGGRGTLRAQAGDHGIRAVLGKSVIHSRFKSLQDKHIPDLSDMGINPKVNLCQKPLLLCFWDRQQRPSRNLLQQLAKKSNELSKQSITTVLVQTTEVEEKTVNQWLKKNSIPFECSLPVEGFEKKQLEWGVKSLPWLILTDEDHIVRAEGFGIDELDKKLTQISGE